MILRTASPQELADYLEVPVKTIYSWRHRNKGPRGFRVGKHLRFRWHDVETWLSGLIAEKYLIHVEAQKQRAEWIDPELSATPLEDWAQRWLATRANLKPKTHAGYESLLRVRILPRFGRERLDRIDPVSIEGWVADLVAEGLSASRVRQVHRVLSQILKARCEPATSPTTLPSEPACRARPGASTFS